MDSQYLFKMDFKKDWIRIIKNAIHEKFGLDVTKIPEDKILYTYLNLQKRIISQTKRKVYEADIFKCPTEKEKFWGELKEKFENGDDVNAYQSKEIDSFDYRDLMLLDWNIFHFHLNSDMNGKFVKRSGLLLYAYITDSAVYAINIMSHGKWYDSCLIETIHRNWPQLIKGHICKGISSDNISEKDRKSLRDKHCNASVSVLDGTTYGALGGGFVVSGESIGSVTEVDKQNDFLDRLEILFKEKIGAYLEAIIKGGYKDGDEIEAILQFDGKDYSVKMPKFSTTVLFTK